MSILSNELLEYIYVQNSFATSFQDKLPLDMYHILHITPEIYVDITYRRCHIIILLSFFWNAHNYFHSLCLLQSKRWLVYPFMDNKTCDTCILCVSIHTFFYYSILCFTLKPKQRSLFWYFKCWMAIANRFWC